MKRRVTNIKRIPLTLLVLAMISAQLFLLSGCGKNKNKVVENTPAPIESPYVPEATPEATPEPTAEPTVEPTVEPEVFNEEAIEKAAYEYYQRLIQNKSEGYVVNETFENVLEMTKRLGGDFSSLVTLLGDLAIGETGSENETEAEKEIREKANQEARKPYEDQYYREIQSFLNSTPAVVINAAVDIAVYGKKATIVYPFSYKLLEAAEIGTREGIETIKLVEEMTADLTTGLEASYAWADFEPKAKALQSLIEAVFLDSDNVWNGTPITSWNDMDGLAQSAFEAASVTALGVIMAKEAQITLNTGKQTTIVVDDSREVDDSSYTTDKLLTAITEIDCNSRNNFGYDATNGSRSLFEIYIAADNKGKEAIKAYILANY